MKHKNIPRSSYIIGVIQLLKPAVQFGASFSTSALTTQRLQKLLSL